MRGRVVDRETGQPLERVMVTLMLNGWRDQEMSSSAMTAQTGIAGMADDSNLKQNEPRDTATAADGRFEFTEVVPGAYTVFFQRPSRAERISIRPSGNLSLGIPRQPSRRVPPLEVRDGETRDDVNIALWRAFAVEGRVVDDAGEPVANAEVTGSPWESPSEMSMVASRWTDDRGMFRIFGLRPGQYRICAEGGTHFGAADVRDRLIRTCYPSAMTDVDAQPVVVSAAEVGPIEIRLQRNRTFRITGMVIDSAGAPLANPSVQSHVSLTDRRLILGHEHPNKTRRSVHRVRGDAGRVRDSGQYRRPLPAPLGFFHSRGETGSRDGLGAGARRSRGH